MRPQGALLDLPFLAQELHHLDKTARKEAADLDFCRLVSLPR